VVVSASRGNRRPAAAGRENKAAMAMRQPTATRQPRPAAPAPSPGRQIRTPDSVRIPSRSRPDRSRPRILSILVVTSDTVTSVDSDDLGRHPLGIDLVGGGSAAGASISVHPSVSCFRRVFDGLPWSTDIGPTSFTLGGLYTAAGGPLGVRTTGWLIVRALHATGPRP